MKSAGLKLFDAGKYKRAITVFKQRWGRDKNDSEALFYLALGLQRTGQYRQSLQYWRKYQKIWPNELNVHLNMGCAQQDLGRNDLAIPNLKKELKLNPISGEALYTLGTLYYNSHKYKQAINYLERCRSLKHWVDEIIARLAYSLFKTDQIEREIELYENFLLTHPKDPWCLNNMGAALMHIGRYSRALIYLKRAAQANPKDQMVMRNIKNAQIFRLEAKMNGK